MNLYVESADSTYNSGVSLSGGVYVLYNKYMRSHANKYNPGLNSEEVAWLRLSPAKRMTESAKLWKFYLTMGGKLDSQPDSQGPFNFPKTKS